MDIKISHTFDRWRATFHVRCWEPNGTLSANWGVYKRKESDLEGLAE